MSIGVPEHILDFRPGSPASGNQVRWGKDTFLSGRPVMERLSRLLPAHAADLVEVAAATYTADRLIPRGRRDAYGLNWSRRFQLHLCVRLPGLWRRHVDRLTALLQWLTDDDWRFRFHQARWSHSPLDEGQSFLFGTVPPTTYAVLFSGGLDSAAGLNLALRDAPQGTPLAVSVATNPRMAGRQRDVLSLLAGADSVVPCRFGVHLGSGQAIERTQRTRGFLFLAAGVATAWAAGLHSLCVFENGIGAINLPLIEAQRGSQATRSVHPHTLALTADLASAIGAAPFRITLPHLLRTKAELIAQTPPEANPAFAMSVSCDVGFSTRTTGARPCGACTSCVLRRQAVGAAGRGEIDAGLIYRTDEVPGSLPEALVATLWQVTRLRRCLRDKHPWTSLAYEFPQVLDVPAAHHDAGRTALLNLYGRYCDEWRRAGAVLGVDARRWGLEGRTAG